MRKLAEGIDDVHAVYSEDVGWKVVADKKIVSGTLIMEYTGKVCHVGI